MVIDDDRSCLGMHLFGGKFCQKADGSLCTCQDLADTSIDCQCDRKHFNSFLWATVTVFQVCAYELRSWLLLYTDTHTRQKQQESGYLILHLIFRPNFPTGVEAQTSYELYNNTISLLLCS